MTKLLAVLKLNQLELDKCTKDSVHDFIKSKINPQNVATFFCLSKLYSLSDLSKVTMDYIQCWFTAVAKTKNFLHLDFALIKRIVSSSELNTTSEIEVFTAANDWMSCNFQQKVKHAKHLLLLIRLPLLTDSAFTHVLTKSSAFHKVDECLTLINVILENKELYFKQLPSSSFSCRYYSNNNFDILHCGDYSFIIDDYYSNYYSDSIFVNKIDGRNLIRSRSVPSLTNNRLFQENHTPVIYLKGHVYLLNCLFNEVSDFEKIEKYSIATDSVEVIGELFNNRENYCACGFIDRIYFIGGYLKDMYVLTLTATCTYFDTENYEWVDVERMQEARSQAACTVFEERIVVSGGFNDDDDDYLNTVEAYDHIADEWTYMPSMIESTCGHSLIAIKNKLFAIGADKEFLEMYDSKSNTFVAIKKHPTYNNSYGYSRLAHAIGMEKKVFIFRYESSKTLCYDVVKDEWFENKLCCTLPNRFNFFLKIPKLNV